MKQTLRAAAGYGSGFLLLFLIEICIGCFASGWLRSYGGDMLVLPLLYCLIRLFTKALPHTLPLCLFGLGCIMELLQRMDLAGILGFPEGSLPAVLIGTRADWMDVVSYGIGTMLIYAGIFLLSAVRKQRKEKVETP